MSVFAIVLATSVREERICQRPGPFTYALVYVLPTSFPPDVWTPVICLTLSRVGFDNHSGAATCCWKGGHVNSLQFSFLWEITDLVWQGRTKLCVCVCILTDDTNKPFSIVH